MAAQLDRMAQRVQKLTTVLDYLGYKEPLVGDAEFISGHYPAFEIYKTPDERVRVEGENTPPGNSLEVSTLGTNDFKPNEEVRTSMVYSQGYVPTGVELQLPTFVMPQDERTLQVLHDGEEVFRCEVPTLSGPCKFDFTAAMAGQRFLVKATQTR